MRRLDAWRMVLLLVPLLVLPGCKKKPAPAQVSDSPAAAPEDTRSPIGNYIGPAVGRVPPLTALSQFAQLYLIEASGGKPPQSLADMPDLRRDLPKSYKAFEDGRYVVVWGTDPNRAPEGTSRTVLAYEKAAPEKGGIVAFLDGSARNVSVQEFQTFAKPGAK